MFIRTIKDSNHRPGLYCSLVQSVRENGKPSHKTIFNFGFVTYDRIPYLKAAFNEGNPEEILLKEKELIKQISEK